MYLIRINRNDMEKSFRTCMLGLLIIMSCNSCVDSSEKEIKSYSVVEESKSSPEPKLIPPLEETPDTFQAPIQDGRVPIVWRTRLEKKGNAFNCYFHRGDTVPSYTNVIRVGTWGSWADIYFRKNRNIIVHRIFDEWYATGKLDFHEKDTIKEEKLEAYLKENRKKVELKDYFEMNHSSRPLIHDTYIPSHPVSEAWRRLWWRHEERKRTNVDMP